METGMITHLDFQVLALMAGIPGQPMDLLIRSGVSLEAIDNLSQHGVNAVSVGIIDARTSVTVEPRANDSPRRRRSPVSREQTGGTCRASVRRQGQGNPLAEQRSKGIRRPDRAGGGRHNTGYVATEETLDRINHGLLHDRTCSIAHIELQNLSGVGGTKVSGRWLEMFDE